VINKTVLKVRKRVYLKIKIKNGQTTKPGKRKRRK
jgi:hypothetical protein